MGRKLCLPSLFFFRGGRNSSGTQFSWGWPSCHHPKTHSFRAVAAAAAASDHVYKMVNSVYFDSPESHVTFTEEETESFSTTSASGEFAGEGYTSVESLIRRNRSDRLFFEPKEASSSSIMEEYVASGVPFKQSIVMAMESEDPCGDFKVSMEEMVAAHGLDDWERLLRLLVWYLKANMKETHGFIFGAFLDLVADLAASAAASSSSSLGSASSEIVELQPLQERRLT